MESKRSSNWGMWTLFYGTLAGIFMLALRGDSYAMHSFIAIIWLRIASLVMISTRMGNFVVTPRTLVFGSAFYGGELFIVLALLSFDCYFQALCSVIVIAVYEFFRIEAIHAN